MVDRIEWATMSGEEVEKLLGVFICTQHPEANRIRPSTGDNGIDLQVKNPDGTFDVYQIKRFSINLGPSQKRQIKESFNRICNYAKSHDYVIANWYLVMPLDPTTQNEEWFKKLTSEASFQCSWKGLTNIEAWASSMQNVVDYYVKNGSREVERRVKNLASITSLKDVTEGDVLLQQLQAIQRSLNDCDPNYSYQLNVVDKSQINKYLATPNEKRVLIFFQEEGNQAIIVDVVCKYREAPVFSKIKFDFLITPQTDEEDKRVKDFKEYGAPLLHTNAQIKSMEVPHLIQGMLDCRHMQSVTLSLVPIPDSPPTDWVLETSNDSMMIHQKESSHGSKGFRWNGSDITDCFNMRLQWDENGQLLLSISIRTREVIGKKVVDSVKILSFIDSLKAEEQFEIRSLDGDISIPVEKFSFDAPLDTNRLSYATNILAKLQHYIPQEILCPDLDKVPDSQIQDWCITLIMLEHKESDIIHEWNGTIVCPTGNQTLDNISFPSGVYGVNKLFLHVAKEKYFLGLYQWFSNIESYECKHGKNDNIEYRLIPMRGIDGYISRHIIPSTAENRKRESSVSFCAASSFTNRPLNRIDY